MKVMKAFGPGDLRVVDAPVPEPPPGHVLVKVRASGICGSDKGLWRVKEKSDRVAGHEAAGVVDALGHGVTSLKTGDRVMVNNVVGCGKCPACRSGAFVLCPCWDGSKDVNNGFGEYLVAPARNCLKILPGLDYIDGALIMDNWGTPYGGIIKAGVGRGTDVLVSGCGPIGQAAARLSKAMGAYVIACDPLPFRRQAALSNGADAALTPDELPGGVRELTDRLGADVVLECSGKGNAYEGCLSSLKIGGRFVAIGEDAEFTFRPSQKLIRRSLTVTGTWYSTLPQASDVMRMALDKKIEPRAFLTHTVKLGEAPGIFGRVVDCEDGIIKCVITFDE